MPGTERCETWLNDLRWQVGALVFAMVSLIGTGCAVWALHAAQASGVRAAHQNAQAMAQSVAQTLTQQLGRAARLGIPLAELPGLAPYLQAVLKARTMLTAIVVTLPDGTTLQSAERPDTALLPADPVIMRIVSQGTTAATVTVNADGGASMQSSQEQALWFAALAVVAAALGAAVIAALGPGAQLERERRAVRARLLGLPAPATAGRAAPGPHAVLRSLDEAETRLQASREQLAAYAQELLSVDFDGRMGATIERIRKDACADGGESRF